MFKIKVPASSANLGSGFDTFGLAFNLYNTFGFEKSDEFSLEGFSSEYTSDRNLVFSTYVSVFTKLKIEPIPVKITLIESQIPITRGLGSSSTCVVAGVIAANIILGSPLSQQECLTMMASLEGHPDNVSASYLGGFTASLIKNTDVLVTRLMPSIELQFYVLVPAFHQSTEIARMALPRVLPFEDIVYSLSRATQLPIAMEQGNILMISECVKDKIHEPYRYPLIESGEVIKASVQELGGVVTISGSGPALLVMTLESDFACKLASIHRLLDWQIMKLEVDSLGTIIFE